jgi:CDGSH-type Zn-finger protein
MANDPSIMVTEHGPYIVQGRVPLSRQTIGTDADGVSRTWDASPLPGATETYALCRCGASSNKPFCDGTHQTIGFDGTETASRDPYLAQIEEFDGPELLLSDVQPLCAYARFCDADGAVWNLVARSDNADVAATVIREAGACPSGRLVAWDRATKTAIEPDLSPSIGIVEDPQEGISGPIWVRGGVPIRAADGITYEVRNRVTLCRCGASENKPFCDAMHATIKFRDDA